MTDVEIALERKAFGDHVVLADVKLTVPPAQICAVMGASGCGKTTLLSIVAGIDTSFQGHVGGRDSVIGYVFQEPHLLPWLTAAQNVGLAILDRPDHREIARGWLAKMALADAADVYPAHLSLGMARRVAVARALAVNPSLLFLDEPFASLDQGTADRLRETVFEYARRSRATTFIATHRLGDAVAMADRLIMLSGNPATVSVDLRIGISDAFRRHPAALKKWEDLLIERAAETDSGTLRCEA